MKDSLFDKDAPEGPHLDRSMMVRVEPVTILTVNTRQGWVDCQPEGDSRLVRRVPIAALYEHPDGSGLFTMPRDGALATLLYPERGTPRLLAYRSEWRGEQGFAGNRPLLSPGDTIVQTSSGAYLGVRNRGILEALSTPGLSWAMTPDTNKFFLRAENMDFRAMGGRWRWRHDRATGLTRLRHDVTDHAQQEIKLETTYGHHNSGALFRQHYQDPTVVPGPQEQRRQVTYSFGNLGGGRRILMDVDDGMYVRDIGQTDEGVVRTKVTDHNPAKRGQWSFEQTIGPQGSTLLKHLLKGLTGNILELMVDEDGTCQIELNGGKTTIEIDADGKVDLQTADTKLTIDDAGQVRMETAKVKLVSDEIRLGSDDADEQLVLGNAWNEHFNMFMATLLLHQHIGNMGAPTGPVIDHASLNLYKMMEAALSDTVFAKK